MIYGLSRVAHLGARLGWALQRRPDRGQPRLDRRRRHGPVDVPGSGHQRDQRDRVRDSTDRAYVVNSSWTVVVDGATKSTLARVPSGVTTFVAVSSSSVA